MIHEMIDLVNSIESQHDQYEEYVENRDKIERVTLESFAQGVVEDSTTSVKGMLARIQKILRGPSGSEFRALGNRGLLELIAKDMKVNNYS